MKKRYFALLLIFVIVMSFGLAGCGGSDSSGGGDEPAADQTVYEVKFAHQGSAASHMNDGAAGCEARLNEISMEKVGYEAFKFTVYTGGQIASSDNEDFEMVQNGTIQYSYSPNSIIYQMLPNIPALNLIDLPYMFMSSEAFYTYCDESDIMKQVYADLEASTGVKVGCAFYIGDLYIGSSKDINNLASLKGQKIRTQVSDIYIGLLQAFGTSPTPIAFSEVYTALQQGTVDGVMASQASMFDQKFFEVAGNIIANAPGLINPEFTVWNAAWLESLPDDIRACVEEFIGEEEANVWRTTYEEYLPEVDGNLTGAGANISYPDEATLEEFKAAALSIYPDFYELCGGEGNVKEAQDFLASKGF